MTSKPKTRTAPAADPIFALIAAHKAREKEWLRLGEKLEVAAVEAEKTHGPRLAPWIDWRNKADHWRENHRNPDFETTKEKPVAAGEVCRE